MAEHDDEDDATLYLIFSILRRIITKSKTNRDSDREAKWFTETLTKNVKLVRDVILIDVVFNAQSNSH